MVGFGDFGLSLPLPTTRLIILLANDILRFLPCEPLSDEAPLSGVSSLLRPGEGEGDEETAPPNLLTGEKDFSRYSSLKL